MVLSVKQLYGSAPELEEHLGNEATASEAGRGRRLTARGAGQPKTAGLRDGELGPES